MFWNIVLLIVFWFVGIFLYSIGIMQIILSLTCAIPLSRKTISKCNFTVDAEGIYKKITLTIVIWALLSFIIFFSIIYWGSSYIIIGFIIGIVLSFLISLGKWGMTQKNCEDYFSVFYRYYAEQDLIDLGIMNK